MSHINDGMTLPATVHTSDIQNSIMYFCKTSKIPYKELDFFIVKTITKVIDKTLAQNEAIILESEGSVAIDERFMNSAGYDIKQTHTISIYAKEEGINFKLAFEADEQFCIAKVILKKGSTIVKNRYLERMLYSEISKTLAINGVILHHFDTDLRSQIFSFARAVKDGILENDFTFIAAKAHNFEPPVVDEINYIFHKNKHLINNERISHEDLYDQNYVKEAKAGDLLIEYKKPIEGKAGRNCKGIFIEPSQLLALNAPKFTHDIASVERLEQSDRILFIAKKEGFVNIYNNILAIDDSINVRKIGAKETGTIRSKEAKDASVNVLEDNPIVDAIGPGMTVNVAKLRVNGSVSNDAKLHAKEVEILGVTHATSYITATNSIKIKNHRGAVESPSIEIVNLEGGVVNGDSVKIKVAHHGIIRARNVFIERLGSNCTIVASESITIEHIQGEENDLYITPSATLHNQIMIKERSESVHTLGVEVKKLQDAVENLTEIIHINKANVAKIAASKSPIMPDIHRTIVQRFKDSLSKLKKLQGELEIKKAAKKRQSEELNSALGSVFRARIKIGESFSAKQTIHFASVNGQDYYYVFKEMPVTLKLIQTPDNKYSVVSCTE